MERIKANYVRSTKKIVLISILCLLVIFGLFITINNNQNKENNINKAIVNRVVDGDTIEVNIENKLYKIRLLGINAPESVNPDNRLNTASGVDASNYLKSILHKEQIIYLENDVNQNNTDKYGRLLRYVWIEYPSENIDNMINYVMIKNGYATVNFYGHNNAKYLKEFTKIK